MHLRYDLYRQGNRHQQRMIIYWVKLSLGLCAPSIPHSHCHEHVYLWTLSKISWVESISILTQLEGKTNTFYPFRNCEPGTHFATVTWQTIYILQTYFSSCLTTTKGPISFQNLSLQDKCIQKCTHRFGKFRKIYSSFKLPIFNLKFP